MLLQGVVQCEQTLAFPVGVNPFEGDVVGSGFLPVAYAGAVHGIMEFDHASD